MRLCYNISQIGMPVVLCGCSIPEQFECCDARKYFTHIHYIAVVTREEVLRARMIGGRKIIDENWINSSVQFN